MLDIGSLIFMFCKNKGILLYFRNQKSQIYNCWKSFVSS